MPTTRINRNTAAAGKSAGGGNSHERRDALMLRIQRQSALAAMFALFTAPLLHADSTARLTQNVKQAHTALTVNANNNSITAGQSVQFTASLSPLSPTVPTGMIQFVATGANPDDQVVSSPVAFSATGLATWTPTLSNVDQYTVTATYAGDANYLASTSQPILESVTAPPATPDFALNMPSTLTVTDGGAISGTVTVTPKNGFTGTVTFTCSGMPQGTSCNFTSSAIQVATANASQGAAQTISFTITTTAITVATSSAAFLFIGFAGFEKRRKLSAAGFAAALLCALGALAGCAGGNRYTQSQGTLPGTYPLTITATCGSITHTATVNLTVAAK